MNLPSDTIQADQDASGDGTTDFIPSQTILHFLQRLGEPLTANDISWRLAYDLDVVTEALTALEASQVISADNLHGLRVYKATSAKAQ